MSNTLPSEYYWRARNADTNHQSIISGQEDHQSRTQCHQNTIGGRAMPTPIIRTLLAGRPRKPNTVPSEYYWRVRNANTSHQNTISGREDHQRGTQCHQNTISGQEDHQSRTQCRQNTIGGRAMPTPIIRILSAGGKTAKAKHSAIRILLASAQCQHQSSEYY